MKIIFDELEFSYKDFSLSVNLEISSSEFVSVLGPSGCGKTTLLRLLAGFLKPSSGRIYTGGRDITDLPTAARNIGMVFQDYALFPHLNVFSNIAYGLKTKRMPLAEISERVSEMLELTGLSGYEDRRIDQLSGGEKQRIALARAMAPQPDVLLFDEPLSALDVKLRRQLRDEIREVQSKAGFTSLYVTHDQEEAFSLSSRIAVMKDGVILQFGTAEDIYNNPADRFTAEFVGTMNVLETDNGRIMFRPEACLTGKEADCLDSDDMLKLDITIISSVFSGSFYLNEGISRSGDPVVFHSHDRLPSGSETSVGVDIKKLIGNG